MALKKRIEFAKDCGISRAALTVNIKRGKVMVDEELDLVDDEHPMNVAFMDKMKMNAAKKNEPLPEKEITPTVPKRASRNSQKSINTKKEKMPVKTEVVLTGNISESSEDRKHYKKKQELETVKLEEEAERMRTQTRILRLQEERALGKMVPTDVIKSLFAQHFKSMTTSFKDAIDVIVLDFSKRAKLNRNEIAEFKGELIVALNSATGNAITMSNKQISGIVSEYSQAKK